MTEFLIISYVIGCVAVFTTGIHPRIEGVNFLPQFVTAVITGLGWPLYVLVGILTHFLIVRSSSK